MGKQWKQWETLFSWAPKSLQMVTAAMKLKDTYYLEVEKAMATHSSTLASKIPWTEEPGRLQSMGSLGVRHNVHGVARSWTQLSDFIFTFHFHALEKKMATHSSVLAWRIPGTGSLVGCHLWELHRVGHNWSNLAAAAAAWGKKGK